jgi:hypothetical protein
MSRAVSRRPERDNRSAYDDGYDDRYTERFDDRYDDRYGDPYENRRSDRFDDDRYTERRDDRYDDGYSEPASRRRRNRNTSPSAYSDDSFYTRRRQGQRLQVRQLGQSIFPRRHDHCRSWRIPVVDHQEDCR